MFFMKNRINKLIVKSEKKIRDAMRVIKKNASGIAFVEKNKQIIGSVTDGDIRKHLLNNGLIDDKVDSCMNKNFKFIKNSNDRESILKLFDQGIKYIPLIDENFSLIEVIDKTNSIIDKKSIIRSRCPARISLGGGGTDLTNFFFENEGSGISFAIEKYCYVTLEKRIDKKIIINSSSFNKSLEYKNINFIKYDGNLDLIKAPIKLLKPEYGFSITIETDFPPMSGLGGSAAIISSIIGVLNYFQERKLTQYEIAELAFECERIELKILGGWQDQYSTVFGGCNFIEFRKQDNLVHNLILPDNTFNELELRLVICDTGNSHKGKKIHSKNIANKKLINFGHQIKKIVDDIKLDLLKGKLNNIGSYIQKTWNLKKEMNILTTNKKINFIEKKLLGENLASGCRLLGSGGGGYLLFYVKPENRFNFIKRINILKIPYFNVRFDHQGLQVWEIER